LSAFFITKKLVRWVRLRLVNLGQPVASRISRTQIGQIMHDVLVVPETKVLQNCLLNLKSAVVTWLSSSTNSVRLRAHHSRDILEQLVGDIEDEFDVPSPSLSCRMNPFCCSRARSNIRDLEAQYNLLLPRDAGFETLAGFILARLQRIPFLGESFEYEGHRYTVEEMEGHRIAKVKIEKVENAENKAESAKQAGD